MPDRKMIIENCMRYLGKPYVWGGESEEEGGYDCSGFIWAVLRDSGMAVGRTTAQGYRQLGRKIERSRMQPGDLLFFGTPSKATHIAIYAGNGTMYESIGGSRNTKSNPGKGVTLSGITRRNDLIEVRALFGDIPKEPGKDAAGKDTYTQKAFIRDVQAAIGAKADGIAGSETIAKTVTISASKNRRHAAVVPVQKYLASLLYKSVGKIDGIAGPKFTAAVKEYQKDHGCVADGEITARNKTWRSMLGMA